MALRTKAQPFPRGGNGISQPPADIRRLLDKEKGVPLSRFGADAGQLAKGVDQLGEDAFGSATDGRLIVTVEEPRLLRLRRRRGFPACRQAGSIVPSGRWPLFIRSLTPP
jgi:hypothetical protein